MSGVTDPESANEVYNVVMAINHFNVQDLEANRKLELSPGQKQEVQRGLRGLLIIVLLCAAGILSAILVPSIITGVLAILGGIFGSILGVFLASYYLKSERAHQVVDVVEGLLTKETKVTWGKGPHTHYYYRVGDKTFILEEAIYAALTQDLPVRAYYLVGNGNLINLELLKGLPPEAA